MRLLEQENRRGGERTKMRRRKTGMKETGSKEKKRRGKGENIRIE